MLGSFEKLTLSEKIAEYIAAQIIDGTIPPGERLLEENLIKIYGTSRAPIREALFILETQGVVERFPRRGVFVKKYSRSEIIDFYDVVYRLTEIALTKGLNSGKQKVMNDLFNLISDMEKTIEHRDFKECFLLVETLHSKLFELSDNKVLVDLYNTLNKRWTTFRYLTLSHPDSLKRSVSEYKKIVEGLEQKDLQKVLKMLNEKEKRATSILKKSFIGPDSEK